MPLRIRLQRVGKKNRPMFRVVVIDSKESVGGKPVDIIGIYDPIKHQGRINFDKYEHWQKLGAIPTDTVKHLYRRLSKNKKLESEIISSISTSQHSDVEGEGKINERTVDYNSEGVS